MKWIIFVILLYFLLGALFIVSNNNLHLSKRAEFAEFYALYYSWVAEGFSQAKSISSAVVKLDWLPSLENKSRNFDMRK